MCTLPQPPALAALGVPHTPPLPPIHPGEGIAMHWCLAARCWHKGLAAFSAQLLEDEAKPCPRSVFWERMGQLWGEELYSHSSPQWPRCWPNRCHLPGGHRGDAPNTSETQVMPCMKEPACPWALWLFTGGKAASAVLGHIPLAAVIHCHKYVRTDGSNCIFLYALPSVLAHCYLILLGEILYASSTAQKKTETFIFKLNV